MGITVKTTLLIVVSFLLLMAAAGLTVQQVMLEGFERLETADIRRNTAQARHQLDLRQEEIARLTVDWAEWDEAYRFVEDQDPKFVAENLLPQTLQTLKLNFVMYVNKDGRLVHSVYMPPGEKRLADPPPEMLWLALPRSRLLRQLKLSPHRARGMVMLPMGPAQVVAWPVLHSDATGPENGAIIAGQLIDENYIEQLRVSTGLNVNLYPLGSEEAGYTFLNKVLAASPPPGSTLIVNDSDTAYGYQLISGLGGLPVMALQVAQERDIHNYGLRTIIYFMLWLCLAVGLVLLVLVLFLRKTVLGRITSYTNKVREIGDKGDLSLRLEAKGSDEIAQWAHQFDHTVEQLSRTRKKMMSDAYDNGQYQMISGVLHNVGNALSPMVFLIDKMQMSDEAASFGNMATAARELAAPDTDPERRRNLARYLNMAIEQLEKWHESNRQDLGQLSERSLKVIEILNSRRTQPKVNHSPDLASLDELLDDSQALMKKPLPPGIKLVIDPSLKKCGKAGVERIVVCQVLANVLNTALMGFDAAGKNTGLISARAESFYNEGQKRVRLTITDQGAGMDKEELDRLFEEGHVPYGASGQGLGMHWSANAVNAMHGSISAQPRQGGKKGVSYIIEIPWG